MYTTIKNVDYIFHFQNTNPSMNYNDIEKRSETFFKTFRNPESVKSILQESQYSVYQKIMEFIEHQEDDIITQTFHVIKNNIFDFETNSDSDNEFVVGFAMSRHIEEPEVKLLYMNVIIPLMEILGFESLNRYLISIEYRVFETINGTV